MANYKNAKNKALYIIGNDKEKMLDTVKSTEADDVQVIGLVSNIAHTAYTVHVKSKGINTISTFNVDCDLVARRLVLKHDGKPELYSVQSLKSVKLSPTAQPSRWVKQFSFWVGFKEEQRLFNANQLVSVFFVLCKVPAALCQLLLPIG